MRNVYVSFEGIDSLTSYGITLLASSLYENVIPINKEDIGNINDGLVVFFRDSMLSLLTCFHPINTKNICVIYVVHSGHDFHISNSFRMSDDLKTIKEKIFDTVLYLKGQYHECLSCNLVAFLSKKDIEWICCRTYEIQNNLSLNLATGSRAKLESLRKRRLMKKLGVNSTASLIKCIPVICAKIDFFHRSTIYKSYNQEPTITDYFLDDIFV